MQLKLKSRLYDRLMVPSMLLYLALFAGCGIALAQERSIEPMFLEIDKKYQLPEGWSILAFEEIKAVIVYLGSIADDELSKVKWDEYLLKREDDMTDEEYDKMDQIFQMG